MAQNQIEIGICSGFSRSETALSAHLPTANLCVSFFKLECGLRAFRSRLLWDEPAAKCEFPFERSQAPGSCTASARSSLRRRLVAGTESHRHWGHSLHSLAHPWQLRDRCWHQRKGEWEMPERGTAAEVPARSQFSDETNMTCKQNDSYNLQKKAGTGTKRCYVTFGLTEYKQRHV